MKRSREDREYIVLYLPICESDRNYCQVIQETRVPRMSKPKCADVVGATVYSLTTVS